MTMKRAVITGGSRGIGRETAIALARSGWAVAIVARGDNNLRDAARACEQSSPSVLAIPADVRTPGGVSAISEAVTDAWSGVDVLINNAGVFSESRLKELSPEQLDDAWATNARATILVTQALLDQLQASRGHIINMGSRSAVIGISGETAFCATKHAVAGFSAALRAELRGSGVRVSCVHPAPVNTWGAEGSDAQGLLTPGAVASFLKFIAEADAEFYDVRFGMPEERVAQA
jgi:short-subunit dehydrogenase